MERAIPSPPIWPCSGWGLPCDLCHHRPGALLPHHFTIACAANGHRRFLFCCTFRRLATPGRYPAPCPVELGLSSAGQVRRRSSLATLADKMSPSALWLPPPATRNPKNQGLALQLLTKLSGEKTACSDTVPYLLTLTEPNSRIMWPLMLKPDNVRAVTTCTHAVL